VNGVGPRVLGILGWYQPLIHAEVDLRPSGLEQLPDPRASGED
jgi:hypothetical protein